MDETYIDVDSYARNSDTQQENSQATQVSTLQWACDKLIPDLFGGVKGRLRTPYKDEDKSASKKKIRRPDFERLMSDIEAGKVRVLMVVNLSRFSRLHHVDAMRLHTKLYENNVKLVSIDDRKIISIDELVGFIEVALKSHNDHEYARTMARNTLRGQIRSVERGHAVVNQAPYGMAKLYVDNTGREHRYSRLEKITKPKGWQGFLIAGDATEIKIVRWLFATYAEQDVSRSSLAVQLNKHTNPAVRSGPRGNGWCEETVRHLLSNYHYAGKTYIGVAPRGEHYKAHGGDIIEAKKYTKMEPTFGTSPYEGIISAELFDKVQLKLERSRERNAKPQSRNTEGHPLTGCLICGNCGKSMFAFPNRGNTRYQCQSAGKPNNRGCHHWSVREDEMLAFLLAQIDRAILKKLEEKPTVPVDTEVAELQERIAEIDQKIAILKKKIASASVDTVVVLADMVTSLSEARTDLLSKKRANDPTIDAQRALDAWEALIEPICVGVRTDDVGVGDPVVEKLGLQDEADRLFNVSLIRPSVLRAFLHSMNTQVRLWFTSNGKEGRRTHWKIDHGRIEAVIDSRKITTVGTSVYSTTHSRYYLAVTVDFTGADWAAMLATRSRR